MGRIMNTDGKPMSNVHFDVGRVTGSAGRGTGPVVTDVCGYFSVYGMAPGSYALVNFNYASEDNIPLWVVTNNGLGIPVMSGKVTDIGTVVIEPF
jgi:hypothetical protein